MAEGSAAPICLMLLVVYLSNKKVHKQRERGLKDSETSITTTTTTSTMAVVVPRPTSLQSKKTRSYPSHFFIKPISNSFSSNFKISNQTPAAIQLVQDFNPKIPLEKAKTPPSSWYTDPSFYDLELHRVFYRGWQAVGFTDQIKSPHDYFTGRLGSVQFVISRDATGKVHAFHNVCRHHASLLASGSGKKSCFVCPYHGWTYGLDGVLLKATRISEIQNFNVNEFGLIPLPVAIWGPFILINLDNDIQHKQEVDSKIVENDWLGSCSETLRTSGIDSSLSFLCRREYTIRCNWKVFCDNYLDGGYHVPYAHTGLASSLNLESYATTIYEKASLQICEGGSGDNENDYDRLGSKATYAFIYPNFMINRYGPWMDTNLVLPLGPNECQVIFDYFIDPSLKDDKAFIEKSLEESERVQMEDIALCEGVQSGLESPAYCTGSAMSNLAKLEFVALDVAGKNYLPWVLDADTHLDAKGLGDTLKEENKTTFEEKAKAMIFLRHHLHEGLKNEYLTVKDPQILWSNLKERYDH